MTNNEQGWQTIETAPKDQRILLAYNQDIFEGINVLIGKWNIEEYSKNPKPYWEHGMQYLSGVKATRLIQPTHWMPIPTFIVENDK